MQPLNKFYFLSFLILFATSSWAQPASITETQIASGFDKPVGVYNAGDGSNRLFIVEQDGYIKILDNGSVLPTYFMDIDSRVNSGANERGLLGLAFHPDYQNNGYFYVNYTNNSGDTRISRFSVTANPDVADANSELILMTITQPYANHNAGDIAFGPDGYLYIPMGDGGSGGDPQNYSQNNQSMLGKMLRIDVDSGSPYAVPSDNPFVGNASVLDEIWATGLRNPWRISFDRMTGDLWIADVGQNDWEEIDFQPANSPGGENYGWRCYEGNAPYNTSGCGPISNYTFPVAEYAHSLGVSVTGGYVYRGIQNPDMYGYYFYADYGSGRIWATGPNGAGGWNTTMIQTLSQGFGVSAFGESEDGELYNVNRNNGRLYRIDGECPGFAIALTATDESGSGTSDGSIDLAVSNGSAPYSYSWSHGATTEDVSGLAAGTYTVTVTDDNGCTLTESADVNPGALSCDQPNVLNVSSIGTTLDFSWDLDPNAQQSQLQYRVKPGQAGAVPDMGTDVVNGSVTSRTVTINANNCGLIYQARLRHKCDATTFSPWKFKSNIVTNPCIREGELPKALTIFPNPVPDVLQFSLTGFGNETAEVVISDVMGKAVYTMTASGDQSVFNISESKHWPAGLYFISAKSANSSLTSTFILAK